MSVEASIELLHLVVIQSLMLVSPMLLTTISVGLAISLIQAVTSIQEQTLAFVPKLFAIGIAFIISSHWMVRSLMQFTVSVFERIPEITR